MISISNLKLYDDLATISHVKSLAFDRSSLSTGEIDTINYIQKELAKQTIETNIEFFTWMGPINILMRICYFIILSYLLIFRLFLVIVVYFIIKNTSAKLRRISLVKKNESINIFVKISAKKKSLKPPLVIFSAHYDSISAKIPYKFQRILYFIYKIMFLYYCLLTIVLIIWFILDLFLNLSIANFFILLVTVSSLTGVYIAIPIFYIFFEDNRSKGSIDNASGVAILIELAKILNKNPLEKMDVLFLWCGAEEWGNKGSNKFCAKHYSKLNQEYDLNKSININIDMIGTYIGLVDKTGLIKKKKMNDTLNDNIEISAKKLDIPLTKYVKTIGPKSDHNSFRSFAKKSNKNFQVCCFHSYKDSKFIHSSKDTPDKCSVEILNGCLNICYDAINSLDLRISEI